MSSASASGMWQFVAATGRDFDLRQNVFRDDRRDVIASTRAALDYLQQLYGQFDDWQLALAAYNWGQGSVQRAQRRNAARGKPQDYASLDMPLETRNYVPKLMAVKNLVQRPGAFNLSLPALENHPYFLAVRIERDIDVALAAQLAGLDLEAFQQFNPQMNQPVILAAGTPQLLLPYDNANRFLRSLQEHRGPLATWTAWVAPRTLSVAEAAREVGMSEAALREVNRIPPRMRVRQGSTLLVPRAAHAMADVNEHLAEHAAILLQPEGPSLRRVVVRAGSRGDTVSAVARRYGVSASQVAKWNGVEVGDRFKARASIVVMLPNRSGGKARASRGGGGKNHRAGPARAASPAKQRPARR
jgi:membrane-bound lytic murein transglycosylase D